MGSPLRLTAPLADVDGAWSIVTETFACAERDLTRFDSRSGLSRLSAAAGRKPPEPISRMLAKALATAARAYRLSAGIFDPRIVGALEAAGEHAGVALPPSPAVLRPNETWLRLDPRAGVASIDAPLDLGGIGKGLALRWATRRLRRAGLATFLLEAGGDVVAGGGPAPDGEWLVAIEQPGCRDPAAIMGIRDAALATSSLAHRHWIGPDGRAAHHLIDPATSRPAVSDLVSVTVAGGDPAWAEIEAKVMLIGGVRFDRPVWAIDRQGRLAVSDAGWRYTTWSRPEARTRPPAVTAM